MAGEGNLSSDRCFLTFSGGTDKAIVAGTASASAQATTVTTGLSSVDHVMVCLAEDHTANVDGISAVIDGGNIVVDQWNDGAAASTGFLDFHWMAIGEL